MAFPDNSPIPSLYESRMAKEYDTSERRLPLHAAQQSPSKLTAAACDVRTCLHGRSI